MRGGDDRYSRQVALFGMAGQRMLRQLRVAVVGLGGVGSHVAQQLALLGVGGFDLVDADRVESSNLNRLIGALEADVGSRKVDVAERLVRALQPSAHIETHAVEFADAPGRVTDRVNVLMSCVDDDGARLEIITRCAASGTIFMDLATDTGNSPTGPWFGGRVLFSGSGERCPSCMDLLDQDALRRRDMTLGQQAEEEQIYGVDATALNGTGPAVVSVNGVIASLAVTELVKAVTGISEPAPLLTYRGDLGTVHRSADTPAHGCFYCASWSCRREAEPSEVGDRMMRSIER
jgi:molybdopterin/thiamine biosynthesis adenylyltransferase